MNTGMRPMSYFMITTIAFCLLSKVFAVGIAKSNFIQLPGEMSDVCSRRTSCRYAVCTWSRSLRINPNTCIFVQNSCQCPEFHVCMPTKNIRPRSGFIKLEYACQRPVDFMIGYAFDDVNRTSRRRRTKSD